MFVRTMAHQHSATEMPGTSADRDHRPLSRHAVGVPQLRHVPASVGGFLNMGNVARWVVGCVGRAEAGFAKAAEARPKIRRK